MNIKESKRIELTSEEFIELIKNGLNIDNNSKIKISIKVPSLVKITIETEIFYAEPDKILRTKSTEVPSSQEDPDINRPVSGKVCGNCAYPYSMGTDLFCPMANKYVMRKGYCSQFEPKPPEDIKF